MGLGQRGQKRIQGRDDTPTVKELFKSAGEVEGNDDSEIQHTTNPMGRPKGGPTKPKTFTLPVELNQRLRRYAFENE